VPDPVPVAAFARAYHRPVLEAFIAAGFLTAQEAGEQPTALPLSPVKSLTDDELLDEVRRRLSLRGGSAPPAGAVEDGGPEPRPDLVWPDPESPSIASIHGQRVQPLPGHTMDPAGEHPRIEGLVLVEIFGLRHPTPGGSV